MVRTYRTQKKDIGRKFFVNKPVIAGNVDTPEAFKWRIEFVIVE